MLEFSALRAKAAAVYARQELEAAPEAGLFDERNYYLAELALIAAVGCRFQGLWDDAREWLDKSEAEYSDTLFPDLGLAKVAYARLAILYHRYQPARVLHEVFPLAAIFEKLGLRLYAIKCKLMAGMALKSIGQLDEAISVFREAASYPEINSAPMVLVRVLSHLGDTYKEQGHPDEAAAALRQASAYLPDSECSATSADFWAMCADLLRGEGSSGEAAELFRKAKAHYRSVGMAGFAAYVSVLLAETELALGRIARAEEELLWALPVLKAQRMVPEECVAVALLEESISRRQLDPLAVRQLRDDLIRHH